MRCAVCNPSQTRTRYQINHFSILASPWFRILKCESTFFLQLNDCNKKSTFKISQNTLLLFSANNAIHSHFTASSPLADDPRAESVFAMCKPDS